MKVYVVLIQNDYSSDPYVDEVFSTFEKAEKYAEDRKEYYKKEGYEYTTYEIAEREVLWYV